MDERQARALADVRARRPEAIVEAAVARRRRHGFVGETGRLMIVAADHPARASLGAGGRPRAMADRWDLLDRLVAALRRPGVDGVLATADILEDLLLLGALDDKVVVGSMNRGGLAGSVFELDDRFTGYTADSLAGMGFDGGKMLLRIDLADPATVRTLEACAEAISDLAAHGLMAMVEPFWTSRAPADDAEQAGSPPDRDSTRDRAERDLRPPIPRVRHALTAEAVATSVAVASGLGTTSAYTWLKLPVVEDMDRVLAASTLPALLLGGDAGESEDEADEMFDRWAAALTLPTARGIVAGRALLYPPDGDVDAAVDRTVALLTEAAPAARRDDAPVDVAAPEVRAI
jgi:DhnA family fructose-bisphosphate aldolase class Ia